MGKRVYGQWDDQSLDWDKGSLAVVDLGEVIQLQGIQLQLLGGAMQSGVLTGSVDGDLWTEISSFNAGELLPCCCPLSLLAISLHMLPHPLCVLQFLM